MIWLRDVKGTKTKQATTATALMTDPKIRTTVSPKSSTPERHAMGRIGTMVFTPVEPFVSNLGQAKVVLIFSPSQVFVYIIYRFNHHLGHKQKCPKHTFC